MDDATIGSHKGYRYCVSYDPTRMTWVFEVSKAGERNDMVERRPWRTYRRKVQALKAALKRIDKLDAGTAVGGLAAMDSDEPTPERRTAGEGQ